MERLGRVFESDGWSRRTMGAVLSQRFACAKEARLSKRCNRHPYQPFEHFILNERFYLQTS